MKTIKLKINNVTDDTFILISLIKQTINKSWGIKYDDFGRKTKELCENEEVIAEKVDKEYIYFEDIIPEDRIIELPELLLYKDLIFRARDGGKIPMIPLEYRINLKKEDTTLTVVQEPDVAYG